MTHDTRRRVLASSLVLALTGSFGLVAQAASTSKSAPSPRWRLETRDPPAAVQTDLVYDAADHVVAAFAGSQFWTSRDGRIWTQQPDPDGDDPITNLVFDAARRQLVAFTSGCGNGGAQCAQTNVP